MSPAERAFDKGHFDVAERRARQALADSPDSRHRLVLARALWRQGRLDEAMLEARRLVRAHPDDAIAHQTLGFVLHDQDRVPEATAAFERAAALAPDRWRTHVGLGNCLSAVGLLGDALEHHRRAVALAPDEPGAHSDLALTHFRMGDYETATRCFDRAIERAEGTPPILRWNAALARLGSGDLQHAWEGYEAGLELGARVPHRQVPRPRWAGEDLSGRTLLVWGEQGLGDEIRFAACYEEVIQQARHVVIETRPRLVELFTRSFPEATVRAHTLTPDGREVGTHDDIDVHTPAGALPRYLRTSLDSFPERPARLTAHPARRQQFRRRLAELPDGLRVGICWRSMNLAIDRLSHYTTLDEWEPVLRVPGVTFVNLQYGDATLREAELEDAEARTSTVVHRWSDVDYTVDVDEVAGLTAELDVVIGPNTFTTILAGALGVPTIVIGLPAIWQHGQAREPWTPSALHLTRRWDQSWAAVMEQAADELRQRATV